MTERLGGTRQRLRRMGLRENGDKIPIQVHGFVESQQYGLIHSKPFFRLLAANEHAAYETRETIEKPGAGRRPRRRIDVAAATFNFNVVAIPLGERRRENDAESVQSDLVVEHG